MADNLCCYAFFSLWMDADIRRLWLWLINITVRGLRRLALNLSPPSNVMDAVAETQGYKDLKTTCPSALADAFAKVIKLT